MTAAPSTRGDLGTVVAEVTARIREHIADPQVFATTQGLAHGPAGAALLLSEASRRDTALRKSVHALLAAAATTAADPDLGLLTGLGGLGFTVKHATRSPQDYATLRTRIDAALRNGLAELLDAEHPRIEAGAPGARRDRFDAVFGVTGIGRYFLAEPSDPAAVRDVLHHLVTLTEPVRDPGYGELGRLPGWFSPPWPEGMGRNSREWVLDLGLAHGVAGPLALLSLCWTRGIRVPDQETAIRRIAQWLMSWRQGDENTGPWWPKTVSAAQERAAERPALKRGPGAGGRPSWCYGTPGIARALHLAGTALGEEEWIRGAADAMRAVFTSPDRMRGMDDPGLCHGLAGLLQITGRMADELEDPSLAARADELAEQLCARFTPGSAFGFPTVLLYADRPQPLDSPTFLEGAAGVALALHERIAPPTGDHAGELSWDAALMLS
ncbi:lanthionine synthetase C family protein [Streptomyces violaceusniger]|uniref:Lanthionine synthetase C family protein n=1 Tax=Streptomyces violaceusniger TaxID=68280 RepID=A0A4D4KUY6_STRVO|nr:hypothetical protein SVIO_026170 [Streptomyces violaceusniger]